MDSNLGGEISNPGMDANARMPCAPSPIGFKVFQHSPVCVVHATVEHQLRSARFPTSPTGVSQQCHRIMV